VSIVGTYGRVVERERERERERGIRGDTVARV